MQALTYLQRALLVHDLQKLDALEWESCFNKVGLSSSLKAHILKTGRTGQPEKPLMSVLSLHPAFPSALCLSIPAPGFLGVRLPTDLLGTRWLFTYQVLFPLLTKLLENISPADVGGMEETRMRASTLLSKVLLTALPTHSPHICLYARRKARASAGR